MEEKYILNVRSYACACHEETNHKYNGLPYSHHLEMVFNFGMKYAHLLSHAKRNNALAACWTHDLIEDCRQTYNDVATQCGNPVADITYAVTNEKGHNRAERANLKYYTEIRYNEAAIFVKICDRLANVLYSSQTKSEMLNAYKKEHASFKHFLFCEKFKEMFDELDQLLNYNQI